MGTAAASVLTAILGLLWLAGTARADATPPPIAGADASACSAQRRSSRAPIVAVAMGHFGSYPGGTHMYVEPDGSYRHNLLLLAQFTYQRRSRGRLAAGFAGSWFRALERIARGLRLAGHDGRGSFVEPGWAPLAVAGRPQPAGAPELDVVFRRADSTCWMGLRGVDVASLAGHALPLLAEIDRVEAEAGPDAGPPTAGGWRLLVLDRHRLDTHPHENSLVFEAALSSDGRWRCQRYPDLRYGRLAPGEMAALLDGVLGAASAPRPGERPTSSEGPQPSSGAGVTDPEAKVVHARLGTGWLDPRAAAATARRFAEAAARLSSLCVP